MKYLLMSLVAGLLVACSSPPEPVKVDPNALPDGIMQPVEGTGAMEGGLMPEIQASEMPATMK